MIKSKTVSLRLTEEQYETIKQRADSKGMRLSNFMLEMSLADEGITTNYKQMLYTRMIGLKEHVYNEDLRKLKEEIGEICRSLAL